MTRYRYIGELPIVLATHSHGRNAEVFPGDGRVLPAEILDGSTVVLNPGDEIETDDPIGHLLIIPTDVSLAKVKKGDLIELAAAWGIDPVGTVDDIRGRLEAYIAPTIEQVPVDAPAEPGAAGAEPGQDAANGPDQQESDGSTGPDAHSGADSAGTTEGA